MHISYIFFYFFFKKSEISVKKLWLKNFGTPIKTSHKFNFPKMFGIYDKTL